MRKEWGISVDEPIITVTCNSGMEPHPERRDEINAGFGPARLEVWKAQARESGMTKAEREDVEAGR